MHGMSNYVEITMNGSRLAAATAFLMCVAGFPQNSTPTASPRPPLQSQQILGTWIGYDQNSLVFYRLVFESNGKGSCAVVYEADLLSVYRVDWATQALTLSIELSPRTNQSESAKVLVDYADSNDIQLTVTGEERSWKHKVVLHREKEILAHIEACQKVQRRFAYPPDKKTGGTRSPH